MGAQKGVLLEIFGGETNKSVVKSLSWFTSTSFWNVSIFSFPLNINRKNKYGSPKAVTL